MTARLPMPDGNTAAAVQHDRDESRREAALPTYEAARESLVEIIMDGQRFPKHASVWSRVSLHDILVQVDQADLSEAVRAHLSDPLLNDLGSAVEKMVCAYFEGDGSAWVDMRRDEMAAEAEES